MIENRGKSGRPALYALVVVGLYLSYQVLGPFLVTLTWAAILAILFHGMQVAQTRRIGPDGAALVTTLVAMLLIVAPAVGVLAAVVHEAPQIAGVLKRTSETAPDQIHRMWALAKAASPVTMPDDPTDRLTEGMQRVLSFLAPHAGAVVADTFTLLGSGVAMLFGLFYMLRDGDAMSRQLRDVLPFPADESDRLISDTRDLVVASVRAGAIVGSMQGLIAGVAFWLVGFPAPVFWGLATAFASLVPVVGAAIVWAPAAAGLLISGNIDHGMLVLLAGVGMSLLASVLRPMLLSGKTSMSGLVVFFGLLGGAAAFGLVGLVIGPIILVTTARLLKVLRHPDGLQESASEEVPAMGNAPSLSLSASRKG
jgi:predicted PurR-regulated permease PerM